MIFCFFGLTSCSFKQLYTGPELAESEVSSFSVDKNKYFLSTNVIKVDDKSVGFVYRYRGYKLLPGTYSVAVQYSAAWENCKMVGSPCPKMYSEGTCSTYLKAKKGMHYSLVVDSKKSPGLFNSPEIGSNREVFMKLVSSDGVVENKCIEITTSTSEPAFHF